MGYYKIVSDGYLYVVGTGNGGTPISEDEYNKVLQVIAGRPTADIGYEYWLREDLTWELVEVPIVDPTDEEISGEELLTMIKEVL